MSRSIRSTSGRCLLALAAWIWQPVVAQAGTITVTNESALTIPQTRVYKTCIGAFASQIFGTLAPGASLTQARTSPVQGSCVWARTAPRRRPSPTPPNASWSTRPPTRSGG
jgi:hypothetical protein